MPTIFTHALIPVAVGLGLGPAVIPRRLMVAGAAVAIAPDLDVIAFHFGAAWGSEWGHRGFSHSLFMAAVVALAGAAGHQALRTTFRCAFLFLFAAAASHGILDAFTNGGSGIAFLWPFSDARHFAPVQPVEVSPIGVSRFLTARGAQVLLSELAWIWLPALAICAGLVALRRRGTS